MPLHRAYRSLNNLDSFAGRVTFTEVAAEIFFSPGLIATSQPSGLAHALAHLQHVIRALPLLGLVTLEVPRQHLEWISVYSGQYRDTLLHLPSRLNCLMHNPSQTNRASYMTIFWISVRIWCVLQKPGTNQILATATDRKPAAQGAVVVWLSSTEVIWACLLLPCLNCLLSNALHLNVSLLSLQRYFSSTGHPNQTPLSSQRCPTFSTFCTISANIIVLGDINIHVNSSTCRFAAEFLRTYKL